MVLLHLLCNKTVPNLTEYRRNCGKGQFVEAVDDTEAQTRRKVQATEYVGWKLKLQLLPTERIVLTHWHEHLQSTHISALESEACQGKYTTINIGTFDKCCSFTKFHLDLTGRKLDCKKSPLCIQRKRAGGIHDRDIPVAV